MNDRPYPLIPLLQKRDDNVRCYLNNAGKQRVYFDFLCDSGELRVESEGLMKGSEGWRAVSSELRVVSVVFLDVIDILLGVRGVICFLIAEAAEKMEADGCGFF